jgi:hypothetical protein
VEKEDFSKGYWNLKRKLGVATHFSEIISLESRPKMPMLAFFLKEP